MGARKKLNAAYFGGSFFIAGVLGLLTGSWTIFALTLAVLLVLNCYDGSIRPKR